MTALRRALGVMVLAAGLFFFVGGAIGATGWRNEIDLARGDRIFLGLVFALLGVLLAGGGWQLLRRSR
jgi:hypothetical protein